MLSHIEQFSYYQLLYYTTRKGGELAGNDAEGRGPWGNTSKSVGEMHGPPLSPAMRQTSCSDDIYVS